MCPKYEKSEVPDIIEGVPVCPGEHSRQTAKYETTADGKIVFQIPDDANRKNR